MVVICCAAQKTKEPVGVPAAAGLLAADAAPVAGYASRVAALTAANDDGSARRHDWCHKNQRRPLYWR